MIKVQGNDILDFETGEILGSTQPKFSGWKYDDYVKEFNASKEVRFLEPMTAQELDNLKDFIAQNILVAEEKFDGHRALNYLTSKGNRLFSRRVSKETGWFSENTDQVPHIRDLHIPDFLYGTVLDNEALLPVEGCSCRSMQSVMGALPETAIKNQLESGFAYFNCFDVLFYCGVNIMAMPYWKRKLYEYKAVKEINSEYIKFADLYVTQGTYDVLVERWETSKMYDKSILDHVHIVRDYEALCVEFIKQGKEGLILKAIDARYEQKRTKSFVKMKAHRIYDVVIMGYEEPTAVVDLSERKTDEDDWLYWMNYENDIYTDGKPKCYNEDEFAPITKFYAMGWIGAIKFGVWKDGQLVEVGQTSGLDEALRKEISENKEKYIGQVIEVEAQHIINKDTGSLQHPRFVQFRPDKGSEQCTFNDHIRKYGEDE